MDFSAKREEPTFDVLLEQKTNQARSEVVTEKDRKRPSSEDETEQKEVKTEKTEKAEKSEKDEEQNCDVAREAASSQIVWLMGQNNQDLLVTKQEDVAIVEQPMLIVVNDEPAAELGELEIPQLTAENAGELNVEYAEIVQEIEQPEISTDIGGQEATDAGLEIRVTGDDAEEIGGEAAVEAPLFENVEAAPIKVAEAPERTQEETPIERQVTEKLSDAIRSGETRVELQLEPLELGKLTIELTHSENGALNILINAENAETRTLLERHINSLQEALVERSQNSVQITVDRSEESQRQEQNNDFRDGSNNRHNEQQRRDGQRSGEDFLQQLRLGLIPIEDEEED